MSSRCCPLNLERLLDGDCSAEEAARLRAHAAACEVCAKELKALEGLNKTLRDNLRNETAPPRLRAEVAKILQGGTEEPRPSGPAFTRRQMGVTALGALAAGVLGAVVVPQLIGSRRGPQDIADTLIRDFETFLFAERVLDVVTPDPAAIASWYRARLDFELPRLAAELDGYRLAGGRLCWLLDRRLASLSFEGGDGSLALYIMSAEGFALPNGDPTGGAPPDATLHHRDRFTNVIWREGDLVLGLVGNAAPERVEQMAQSLSRAAAN